MDDVQKSSKIWQFVFLKILYTYINDELIPISSLDLLLELCNILKLSYDGQANIFEINNKVCIELKKYEPFKNWDKAMLGQFLWKTVILSSKNHWLLGCYLNNQNKSDELINNGFIAIDFNIPDLTGKIKNMNTLKAELSKLSTNNRVLSTFGSFFNIKKGDMVALKSSYTKGSDHSQPVTKIYAYGEALHDSFDGYKFDQTFKHTFPVRWLYKKEKEIMNVGYRQTIHKITDQVLINKIFSPGIELEVNEYDSNVIFYGPPGTGKTYKSKREAVKICMNLSSSDDIAEIKQKYSEFVNNGRIKFITFHQSYGYEEFVEGLRSNCKGGFEPQDGVLKRIAYEAMFSAIANPSKLANPSYEDKKKEVITNLSKNDPGLFDYGKQDINYVLIIDEINRGNISKILGESITIIESDKRFGQDEEVSCFLSYSGEKFFLPPNLFIIGTMNTADRSIALLDSALRRRFSFNPFYPEYEHFDQSNSNLSIDLSELLETINQRIEYLYDRDHTIGHSFFFNIKTNEELVKVFKNKIIPLLEEYFYNDLKKVGLILGGIGVNETDNLIVYKKQYDNIFKNYSAYPEGDNERFVIKNDFGIAEIIKILE